jgi:hypothetical protein
MSLPPNNSPIEICAPFDEFSDDIKSQTVDPKEQLYKLSTKFQKYYENKTLNTRRSQLDNNYNYNETDNFTEIII